MIIAVSGGAGRLARRVTELVLQAAPGRDLVVTTRDPQRLTFLTGQGVDVRQADFGDARTLPQAFAGVDRLLLVSTDADGQGGRRVAQHAAAVDAAAEAGVTHVVYTSLARAELGNPLAMAPDHIATEEVLRRSGLAWTALRNNVYSDGLGRLLAPALATGSHVVNSGAGGTAYISRDDCARAAAAVLLAEPVQQGTGTVYELSGPEAVTAERLVELVSETTGRRLRVLHLDDAQYVASLVGAGLPEPVAEVFATFGRAAREGWLDTVTDSVQRLTGRPATPVRQVLVDTTGASTGADLRLPA